MSTIFLFLAGCCVGAFVRMLCEVNNLMSHWQQGYDAGRYEQMEPLLPRDKEGVSLSIQ